jgi:hypothetical protein
MSYLLAGLDAKSSWNPALEDLIEGSSGITWFNRRIPQIIEEKSPVCDVIREESPVCDVLEGRSIVGDKIEGISPVGDLVEGVSPVADVLNLKHPFR